jgi:hypothetical protein
MKMKCPKQHLARSLDTFRRLPLRIWLGIGMLAASIGSVCAGDEFDLHDQITTFTNLHGRVYENVQLERATHDGLIYSSTNTGATGMVRYSDLSTNLLAELKIPDSLVAEASRRQTALAIEKQQYDEASHQLALQQMTNNIANPVAAATQPSDSKKNSPPEAKSTEVKTKVVHHHRRR